MSNRRYYRFHRIRSDYDLEVAEALNDLFNELDIKLNRRTQDIFQATKMRIINIIRSYIT